MHSKITIGPKPDYVVTPPGDIKLKKDDTLPIKGPKDGCVLCFSVAVDGSKRHNFGKDETKNIPFIGFPVGTTIYFTANAPDYLCPEAPISPGKHTDSLSHVIIISS